MDSLQIFSVTHLCLGDPGCAGITPIYVGHGECPSHWLRDNSGDHIHERNSSFCELTAQYWVWKNLFPSFAADDIVGFFHYRRFLAPRSVFANDAKIPAEEFKEEYLAEFPQYLQGSACDVILPESIQFKSLYNTVKYTAKAVRDRLFRETRRSRWDATVYSQYTYTGGCEGDLLRATDALDSQHSKGFQEYCRQSYTLHPYNIYIARADTLNRYFALLFEWLFKCERVIRLDTKSVNERRVFGFLAELFASYYFTTQCNVTEAPIVKVGYRKAADSLHSCSPASGKAEK